jgi:hypothetical protein
MSFIPFSFLYFLIILFIGAGGVCAVCIFLVVVSFSRPLRTPSLGLAESGNSEVAPHLPSTNPNSSIILSLLQLEE